jgi:hypothetical protein
LIARELEISPVPVQAQTTLAAGRSGALQGSEHDQKDHHAYGQEEQRDGTLDNGRPAAGGRALVRRPAHDQGRPA